MKHQTSYLSLHKPFWRYRSLIPLSAITLFGLAACGQGSVEDFQATLDDGESIDIVLSTDEDDNLVVSFPDVAGNAGDSGEGAIYALTNQHDPAQQISSADTAESLPDSVNQIAAYSRAADGSLSLIGVYDTGGVGENIRNSGANPLASQDPLIVSKDQRFVFAVNAGSESISSFLINEDYSLTPADLDVSTVGASGAQNPVSLTMFEDILYVVNSGNFVDANGEELDTLPADRNRVNASVIGFRVGDDGSLTEIAGSEMPGIGANAGSIEFADDGRNLYITERRTNNIIHVTLDNNFVPLRYDNGDVRLTEIPSITAQPFGTDLYPLDEGSILLVSEGNNGAPGLSALSSYRIEENGALTGISLSSGVEGDPLVTGHTFGCWVEFVETPTGDFAYVSNTPDGVITSYAVGDEGGLTVLESSAGTTNVVGDDTQNGVGVLDAEIVYPYLYQVVNNDGRIAQFEIAEDGSLTRMQDVEIVDTDLFRQGMFVGIAGI